jgi:heme exporter protein C
LSTSSPNSRGAAFGLLAAGLLLTGIALAFYWAPEDADQGFSQRIFYIHVPVALTAYACFGWGAWKALRLLWTRDERYDLESYTAIHMGTIFGVLTLVTGSIWARISWGVWWSWSERQLVLFLVLFLFYSAYFMLRYSVEPGRRRANMSAVYALFGVVLIPVSFLAIRLAENFIHPVVFTRDGPQMDSSMFATFCVVLAGTLALAYALYSTELAGKRLDERLRDLREALEEPAPTPRIEQVAVR